ncbi:MAG: DUF1553 domain-containing protein [Opitutus sp.]|nr:DUF1553 domain-containing protein [Opitutus sp.]
MRTASRACAKVVEGASRPDSSAVETVRGALRPDSFGVRLTSGSKAPPTVSSHPPTVSNRLPPVSNHRAFTVALAFATITVARVAAADLAPDQLEFFESKIRPIFAEHCYKCHSAESGKSKGSLMLDSRDALRKGGGTGPALSEGDPEKSLLIQAIRYADEDLQMPPKEEGGKLSADKIAALEAWVKMGAPDPRVTEARSAAMDMAKARRHWAFQPVTKPAVPAVKNSKWVATPVDAFVLANLEAKKLSPSAPADPRTLLRRVTYDLTGLPPTPTEMDAFLGDRDPQAYANVVDRLLASPRYGERWGRFWLDVARYADTKGYLAGNVERRYPFSHTYRDYVIRAFNEDKPFDRFVVEQLAADRLPLGEDKSALAALGFLTLGRRFLNNQNDIIDDRIDVVSRGLMGLTVTCARCHDHKFDPIPTSDYYSLHGVFASTEEPAEKPLLGELIDSPAYRQFLAKQAEVAVKIKGREMDEIKNFLTGVRDKTGDYLLGAHDAAALSKTEKFELFAGPRKLNVEVLRRWQSFLKERALQPDPVLAPWFALAALPEKEFAEKARELIDGWKENAAGLNPLVVAAFVNAEKPIASLKDAAAIYNGIFAAAGKAWQAALDAAEKEKIAPPAALANADEEAVRQLVFAEGTPPNLGHDALAKMLKRQIDTKTAPLKRDLEALNWTEPGAPLRAMAVADKPSPKNSQIFLRGNPASPGPEAPRQFLEVLSGERRESFTAGSGRLELAEKIASPANPLTARVIVNRVWGWHFGQPLVRTPSDFGVRTEPPVQRALLDWLAATLVDNGWSVKHLHRAIVLSSTYRQSSDENSRASAVDPDNQLVHRFNRHRLELEAIRDTLLAVAGTLDLKLGGFSEDLAKEPFSPRRTVYGYIDRQDLPGMFRTFDYPNPDVSSAQRFATTVPQQALFLMNSGFAQEQTRRLVTRTEFNAEKSDDGKVRALYRVLYQRSPDAEELKLAQAFLRRPETPPDVSPGPSSGWQYGHGRFDAAAGRVRDFQPMTVRKEGRVSPAEKFPDAIFGHLSLTATGGHPGETPLQASIRRWVAPGRGRVKITGKLGHASAAGDGVHGLIVSSEAGQKGEWTVHNQKVDTNIELDVQGGERIDFLVDGGANDNSDSYTWAPNLAFTPHARAVGLTARVWSAKKDFDAVAKVVKPLTRWEELAQVLLLSNELAFVD